jgi:hypothetical protein
MDKHSTFLQTFVNYGRKSFISLGPCEVPVVVELLLQLKGLVPRVGLPVVRV